MYLLDFSKEELSHHGCTPNIVSLVYRGSKKHITIRSSNQSYIIECTDPSDIIAILECINYKLMEHFARMEIQNFKMKMQVHKEFKGQLEYKFLKSIEAHAKDRTKMKKFEVSEFFVVPIGVHDRTLRLTYHLFLIMYVRRTQGSQPLTLT